MAGSGIVPGDCCQPAHGCRMHPGSKSELGGWLDYFCFLGVQVFELNIALTDVLTDFICHDYGILIILGQQST